MLCLSQLSRAPEQRTEGQAPETPDLRESGAIEQDADVVIFLYRDDYYNKEESPEPGVIEFLIEKTATEDRYHKAALGRSTKVRALTTRALKLWEGV